MAAEYTNGRLAIPALAGLLVQFPLAFCSHKKEQNCYCQEHFRASKYNKNAFAAGLCPGPRWGSLQCCPRPETP